ncbi:3BP5L protein, partial [Bucco capensis]|nr:3BP5L protein [Bucco capensis]
PLPLQEHKAKVTRLEGLVAQAKTRYSVALRNLEEISEQIHARRLQRLLLRRASPVGAEASPGGQGHLEVTQGDGGSLGSPLGAAQCPSADNLSVLSLQTIASDLQKFDSVEHLVTLLDTTSLNNQELDREEEEEKKSQRGHGHFKHHRSISL